MKLPKNFFKRTLLLIAFVEFAIPVVFIFHLSLKSPIHSNPAPITVYAPTLHKLEKVNFGFPVRLKIPTINVDASVVNVGLMSGGDLDVPKGPDNTGWYDQGPRPGEIGSSVIDGHFGYKDNIPAVFDNLHTLQKGDKLYVEDERGTTITFVVRELRTYVQNEDHAGVFVSSDGEAHLNLITCQGVWNQALKSYSTRLVVFADKEDKAVEE